MDRWIDADIGNVGQIGYLVETVYNGRTSWSLRERPLRTNRSNEPRLTGWCGETDNRSRTAHGVWKVARINGTGDRAQIVPVDGDELARFLEADGHPDLIPACRTLELARASDL